jgi:RNA polymerase-binding transcription factor DksA
MAAASEVSRRVGRLAYSALSTRDAERLRSRLLAEMGEHSENLAQHAATLEALSGGLFDEMADRDRAMAALSMYVAYEAMQEIADAVARIDDGSYGLCQLCERPIPLELLETSPAAPLCGDCPAPRRGLAPRVKPPRPRQFDATDLEGARGYPTFGEVRGAPHDPRELPRPARARAPRRVNTIADRPIRRNLLETRPPGSSPGREGHPHAAAP